MCDREGEGGLWARHVKFLLALQFKLTHNGSDRNQEQWDFCAKLITNGKRCARFRIRGNYGNIMYNTTSIVSRRSKLNVDVIVHVLSNELDT